MNRQLSVDYLCNNLPTTPPFVTSLSVKPRASGRTVNAVLTPCTVLPSNLASPPNNEVMASPSVFKHAARPAVPTCKPLPKSDVASDVD